MSFTKITNVGGLTRNLSHIEDLQTLTTVRRRLLHGNGLCEDLIEHTGLDAECLILDNSINGLKKLRQTLACLGRDKYKSLRTAYMPALL